MKELKSKEIKSSKRTLLTVQKAADKYGLSNSLFYHWIRYKKFPYLKIDKKILFWETDFISFLENHYVNPNSEELQYD